MAGDALSRRRYEVKLRPARGSAFAWLLGDVGTWSGGATGVRLAASALEDSTVDQYARHWETFVAWCVENGLEPIPATARMILAYVGHLAERGTIAARSLQPYLSAINTYHADSGLERPALGHVVAAARRGLARTQAQLTTTDTRVPLPAAVALRILDRALSMLDAQAARLTPRAFAEWLRRCYATVLAFVFMGRQDSCVRLATVDHGIGDDFIWLRLTEKTKRGQALRRIVRLPLSAPAVSGHASALPRLAQLGAAYIEARKRLGGSHAWFFQLPGEPAPTTRHMESWTTTSFADVGAVAPPGFVYLGHSLRSGGSSVAEAISVPRFRGNWLGGWSPAGRTRELHYLDPSVLPCPAAFALFGWLLAGTYQLDSPAWSAQRGAAASDEPGEVQPR